LISSCGIKNPLKPICRPNLNPTIHKKTHSLINSNSRGSKNSFFFKIWQRSKNYMVIFRFFHLFVTKKNQNLPNHNFYQTISTKPFFFTKFPQLSIQHQLLVNLTQTHQKPTLTQGQQPTAFGSWRLTFVAHLASTNVPQLFPFE
jgi:hypothetical protein